MIYIHNIDPVLISFMSISIHWYGIMYVISFLIIDYLVKQDVKNGNVTFSYRVADSMLLFSLITLLIGGRLGYVLFYDLGYYLANPIKVLYLWEGGMSFHGGLLGVIFGFYFFSKKENLSFFELSDSIVIYIPIALGLGRIGNFINGELYGIPTSGNWGVIFPMIDQVPRHPSMLYEAFLEGLVLFFIMKKFSRLKLPTMVLSSLFLIFYGGFRFLVEFVRLPDRHIGYLYQDWFTMGQLLSMPMMIFGIILLYFSIKGMKLR